MAWTPADLPGAVEHWPLSEAGGTGRVGAMTGAVLAESGGTVGTGTGRFGSGTAASFNGLVSLRRATSSLTLAPQSAPQALAFRLKPAAVAGTMYPVHCGSAGLYYAFLVVAGGASVWTPIAGDGGAGGPTLAAGAWYDMLLTHDPISHSAKCYRNGWLIATGTTTVPPWSAAGQFSLGADQAGANGLNGFMEDVFLGHAIPTVPERYSLMAGARTTNLLVTVGDSITQAAYTANIPTQQYPYLVALALGSPLYIYGIDTGGDPPAVYWPTQGQGSWVVANLGQSAYTSATWLSGSPSLLTTLVYPFADRAWERALMVYWLGANDFAADLTAATVYANMQAACNGWQYAGGDACVVIDCWARTGLTAPQQAQQDAYNASLAADFPIATADPAVWLAGPGVTYAKAMVKASAMALTSVGDGLHINAAGLALIAGKVAFAANLVLPGTVLPAAADVRLGTGYGFDGDEFTGTYAATCDYPIAGNVHAGVVYGSLALTGTRTDAATGDVRSGTSYGDPAAPLVGSLVVPAPIPPGPAAGLGQDWKVWDNREPVTYTVVTRTGGLGYAITDCKRRQLSRRELASSSGAYTAGDRAWLVPTAVLPAGLTPKIADRITDAQGTVWSVLESALNTWQTWWRLVARDLVLHADLRELVTLLAPSATQDAAGGRVPNYTPAANNVPAKILEVESQAEDRLGKRQAVKRYTAWVGVRVFPAANYRLKDAAGQLYTVTGWRSADRFDVLQELDLEVVK